MVSKMGLRNVRNLWLGILAGAITVVVIIAAFVGVWNLVASHGFIWLGAIIVGLVLLIATGSVYSFGAEDEKELERKKKNTKVVSGKTGEIFDPETSFVNYEGQRIWR